VAVKGYVDKEMVRYVMVIMVVILKMREKLIIIIIIIIIMIKHYSQKIKSYIPSELSSMKGIILLPFTYWFIKK